MNTSGSSEHPSVREKNVKKKGGIIGCKYKTFSWHLNGFPDDNSAINPYTIRAYSLQHKQYYNIVTGKEEHIYILQQVLSDTLLRV